MKKQKRIILLVWMGLVFVFTGFFYQVRADAPTCDTEFCIYIPAISGSNETQQTPTPTLPPTPPVDISSLPDNWLERLNIYRKAAGLPPLTEVSDYSSDLAKHTDYMLLNVPREGLLHGENPDNPGYTPEGAQAASESNLWFTSAGISAGQAIDVWMGSVTHRFGILRPDLIFTGFAMSCDQQNCATALNVLRGIQLESNPRPDGVIYPGEGQLGVNTDIVISWQFDWHPTVVLRSVSFRDEAGHLIAYKTTTPEDGDYFNVVSVAPITPLLTGTTYTIEITVVQGERELTRTWQFTTRQN